ncbi:BrxA/BrxB family bacilliredoxin [Streptomyces microflavus]|uniref:BrxA/BrxB family bacilliredoxin n=1 Tax=Streptomyces microflavus TaxID=1919 RepID=A0A7H8N0W3_STRMI|nr:BrxA/BrxB family bacilliredoxin [Streptomyces microflavus]QKW47688.1 BrxA/BrxB family bacilliredoxin [Streptomyces microflavus]
MYSPLLVKPMREELTEVGFTELLTASAVDAAFADTTGTMLLAVNGVKGAAAMARRALRNALAGDGARPARLVTVFAEQDPEPTAKARSYFADIPPSEPSLALFVDGELVWFQPEHRIQGREISQIADDITAAFKEHCPAG